MNMPFPSREQVEFIRKNYPPGTRVMLNNMNDPYSPVEPGTRGTVRYVDDSGQLGVAWDNGRSLSLIPGEDSFRELTQQEIAQEQGMKMGGDGAVSIRLISTEQLRRMGDQEGLVLQGCGGDPQEWLDGINEILAQECILKKGAGFEEAHTFRHDGLTCMLFPFKEDMELDVGKLAVWRLASYSAFGGTWLSDYVPNRLGGFIQEQKTAPERIKGTIEFRMFNSTLHAGEVKSYVFCGDSGEYTMYEDDGSDEHAALTRFEVKWSEDAMRFSIKPDEGSFRVRPAMRRYRVCFYGIKNSTVKSDVAYEKTYDTEKKVLTVTFGKNSGKIELQVLNAELADIDRSKRTFKLLQHCRIGYELKEKIYNCICAKKNPAAVIHELQSMALSHDLIGALAELGFE